MSTQTAMPTRQSAEIQSFDQRAPLSKDAIRKFVPAAFATSPSPARSDSYRFISTEKVIDDMAKMGFMPFSAQQARSRTQTERQFAKHLIRFRQPSEDTKAAEHFEVVVVNSMNGSTKLDVIPGFFRFVCANGLMVGTKVMQTSVRHSGREDVQAQVETVLKTVPLINDRVDAMRETILTQEDQRSFLQKVLGLRVDQDMIEVVDLDEVLKPVRYEDQPNDAWTVFNRIQERMINGGISYKRPPGERKTSTTLPALRNVKEIVRVNRVLWDAAEALVVA